ADYPDVDSVTFTATGMAGAASVIEIVSGDESPDTVATSRTLEVLVTDVHGNVKPGEQVTWQVTGGDGSLSAAVIATNSNGVASVEWTLGQTAGGQSVQASIDA